MTANLFLVWFWIGVAQAEIHLDKPRMARSSLVFAIIHWSACALYMLGLVAERQ